MIIDKLKTSQNWFLDLLFPKKCLGCGQEGEWLCADCKLELRVNQTDCCPICQHSSFAGRVCGNCSNQSSLNGLWVLADYKNELIQKMIWRIKYDFIIELTDYFNELIVQYFSRGFNWESGFLLAPVPLHRRRFLRRGFNQAELICQAIQKVFDSEIAGALLKRTIHRQPQVNLPAHQRRENVKDNFVINQKVSAFYLDRKIILVDDVYTTGATMQECAKVLKEGGFQEVWGLVVARG